MWKVYSGWASQSSSTKEEKSMIVIFHRELEYQNYKKYGKESDQT